LAAKTVQEYKTHFAEWVVASGLAEVLEHFGLFLTVMHQHALAIYKARGLGKDLGDLAEPATPQNRILLQSRARGSVNLRTSSGGR
jgi:hypothetical protein